MLLRLCSSARRRWKTMLWVLLLLVLLLNAVVFVSMPGSIGTRLGRHHVADNEGQRSEVREFGPARGVGTAHLQMLRKGLDKSTANNSSSLHYVESLVFPDGRRVDKKAWKDLLDGSTFEERKKVAGLVYNDNDRNANNIEDDDGNGNEDAPTEERVDDDVLSSRDFTASRGRDRQTKHAKPELDGARRDSQGKNYTLAEVDALVKAFLTKFQGATLVSTDQTSYDTFLKKLQLDMKWGPRLKEFASFKGRRSWEHFHHGIRQHALYHPSEPHVSKLMNDLRTREIVDVEQKEGGTQIKLMITCKDEGQALFKPMRFPREQETLPDHFYFADYERHNAEIASFHLDRLLGFYRVPPTVGRWMNVSSDIHNVANSKLAKTFFMSPVGNWCFHGSCSYYCDSSHPICGHPIMLEGSMAAFLPPLQMAKRKTWRNPWKRSYSKHRKAYWEVYDDLCHKVKRKHPYNEGRRLMDVLDMSVFDFLIGNLDRHHYETFREFGNETFLLHLDNGRAFGKSQYDCVSCLAPVRQCCMIRHSTLAKLVKFYQGPASLSQMMRASLATDALNPILLEPHLDALDRRLSKILQVIHGCLKNGAAGGAGNFGRRWEDVVIDDGVT